MKILITGAAGFIGSHLFDYLKKEGHKVFGIDNFSLGIYTQGDIHHVDLATNKKRVEEVMQQIKPDVVYHLAAYAHEGLSQFMPALITENNYNATLNILTASIRAGVKRFVFTSSMSVYGNQQAPFVETMERKPVDIYGIAKAASENAIEVLSQVHGIEYNIIRPHNVYGERQNLRDPYRNVVAIFINKCLQGEPFYIYGDGEQKRAFTYVHDIIPSIALAGWSDEKAQIMNVGHGNAYTINELATEVMKHFPNQPKPMYAKARPQEVFEAVPWAQTKGAVEYDKTDLITGVGKMVQWAKKQGYQEPIYFHGLEIDNDKVPNTWRGKLI